MKNKKFFTFFLIFLMLLSIGGTAFIQLRLNGNIGKTVEEFDQYLLKQNFSGTVLVAHEGEVVFEKGYGYQNEELGIENSPETAYLIGSITKQFTAAAILKLQEEGKLNVSERVDRYYPEFPNGENITIHHLLTHTSGIPEYLDYLDNGDIPGQEWTADAIINEIQNKPIDFEPGQGFEYNNTAYVMLGGIIEQVSGESYEAYMNEQFFAPLQMDQTSFGYDSQKNQAVGYLDGYEVARYVHPSFPHGGGALASTTHDLMKWAEALADNQVISSKSKNEMLTNYTGDSLFPGQSYGYGQYVVGDGKAMFHPGFIDGFSSNLFYDSERELVVVALSNMHDSELPMIPSFLYEFSEKVESSIYGYILTGLIYVLLVWSVVVLVKWLRGLNRGGIQLGRAHWYRIMLQTIPLPLIGLVFLIIPFIPSASVDFLASDHLLSSIYLLNAIAPLWGDILNLTLLIFVLAYIGAVQPFVKKDRRENAGTSSKMESEKM